MSFVRIALCSFAVALGGVVFGCSVSKPQGRLETSCVEECKVKAKARCTEQACIRGCRFVLDRLMEREGSNVIACVATGKKSACNDEAWAGCAATVGIHSDGGPPAPPPPEED